MRGDYGVEWEEATEFLRKRPKLWDHLQLYWDAYWDLNGDRAGMGDGRIQWTAVHMWARAHGLSKAQFSDLCYYIRAMDTVFLEFQASKK